MDFPFDRHHRRDEDREERDRPPPPQTVHHVSHHMPFRRDNDDFPPPPPFSDPDDRFNDFPHPPPPPRDERDEFWNDGPPRPQPLFTTVQHISHEPEPDARSDESSQSHHFSPHMPSFLHPHHKTDSSSSLANQPTYRVFTKAHSSLSLAVVDAKVVLTATNSSDPLQHWYKDEKYSTQVKDQVGFPSFSLVNKATGQAIKHSLGAGYSVQLIAYDSNKVDESLLWTQGTELKDGFRAIRMVNNIHLNFEALNADKKHGGIHDGTVVGLGEWKKSDNEYLQWKIAPYGEFRKLNHF